MADFAPPGRPEVVRGDPPLHSGLVPVVQDRQIVTPASPFTGLLIGYGACAVAVVMYLLTDVLLRAGVPARVMWIALMVVGVAALLWAARAAWRWYTANLHVDHVPLSRPGTARIWLVARRHQAQALPPLTTDAFDPVVCNVSWWVGPQRGAWRVWAPVTAAALVVLVSLHQAGLLPGRFPNFLGFATAFVAGGLAAGFVFPAYVRVAPGRLDLLRYALWSGWTQTQTFDLRDPALYVQVDLRHRSIQLGTDEPVAYAELRKGRKIGKRHGGLHVSLTLLPGRMALAHAVLCGAVSAAPTPPLPERELIG